MHLHVIKPNKVSFTSSSSTRKNQSRQHTITRSYKDKVDIDYNNQMFFIYALGRYQNTPLYYYGTTNDIDLVEFNICSKLPAYKRVLYFPVEHKWQKIDNFEEYLNQNNLRSDVLSQFCGLDNTFITNNKVSIQNIVDFTTICFAVHT